MNIAHLALESLERFGDHPQLIFEDDVFSSGTMVRRSSRLAGGLREMGVKPGDTVVIVAMNCPEVLVAYRAIFCVGALAVPLLFVLGPAEIAAILADCSASLVITTPELRDRVEEATAQLPSPPRIVLVGQAEGLVSFADLEEGPEVPPLDLSPADPAAILYTSGTTGQPKGVVLSHENLLVNSEAAAGAFALGHDDLGLLALPLSHAFGITASTAGLHNGTGGVLMRWFEPEEAMRLIQSHRIRYTALVPTMLQYLVDHPAAGDYDLSSLEFVVCGAAPLTRQLQERFEGRFGVPVLNGYGLSEASAACTSNTLDDRCPGSVGRPLGDTEVRVAGEDGAILPPGETGEVQLRGRSVMLGYHRLPEETARVLIEGWLRTGDLGHLDEHGHLFIDDRIRDLVIRGGFNVHPGEVEQILMGHPEVAEAAVIGIPDPRLGEEVAAFVVAKPGTDPDPQALVEWAGARLATYKRPKQIWVEPSLPKSVTGKVLKRELRSLAAGRLSAGDAAQGSDQAER